MLLEKVFLKGQIRNANEKNSTQKPRQSNQILDNQLTI
jgi:hypothetical protein